MNEKERYQQYLCSEQWWAKRNAVMERAGGLCEKCGYHAAEHVHHLTYIRKYNEELTDLIALCKTCHESIHQAKLAAIDRKPASSNSFNDDLKRVLAQKDQLIAAAKDVPYHPSMDLDDYLRKLYKELDECSQGDSIERFIVNKISNIASKLFS